MKKYILLLFSTSILGLVNRAQPGYVPPPPLPVKGYSHAASLALHLPLGVFTNSHIAGAGINYAWSRHRFGRSVHIARPVGLTATAGAEYYVGKKVKTAGYDFRYDNYINLYAQAGILVNPGAKGHISLTAGPAFDIYKGNAGAGLGACVSGSYYLKRNIAIGPGLTYKKDAQADALWTGLIRVSYVF